MARNNSRTGSNNELIILNAINNHRYEELDPKRKKHIKKMFKDITDKDMIHAHFYPDKHAKPDLIISVRKRKVMLSIKTGHAPVCHQEEIGTFLYFLKEYNVKDRIIKILEFYHYGMSKKLSNNGQPFTREELIDKYGDYINEVNNYFIEHSEIVRQIIYRSIIQGLRNADPIDYLYYGNVAKGFLLSISDIYKEILSDKNEDAPSPHFYGLTFLPFTRNPKSIKKKYVKILWPVLCVRFYDEDFNKKYE